MTEYELLKAFWRDWDRECYELSCESRDCCECSEFQEAFEDYREELGYMPRILVDEVTE